MYLSAEFLELVGLASVGALIAPYVVLAPLFLLAWLVRQQASQSALPEERSGVQ